MNLEKEQIRDKIRKQLKDLGSGERDVRSENIQKKLLGLKPFKAARCVLVYVALSTEVRTRGIIEHCLRTGQRIVVPRAILDRGALEIREITSWHNDLQPGAFGILEPIPNQTKHVAIEEIDCCVLPGLAFDREGHRMGRGHGFFDKLLASMPERVTRIALGFDFQVVPHVPVESHDESVHYVLTA